MNRDELVQFVGTLAKAQSEPTVARLGRSAYREIGRGKVEGVQALLAKHGVAYIEHGPETLHIVDREHPNAQARPERTFDRPASHGAGQTHIRASDAGWFAGGGHLPAADRAHFHGEARYQVGYGHLGEPIRNSTQFFHHSEHHGAQLAVAHFSRLARRVVTPKVARSSGGGGQADLFAKAEPSPFHPVPMDRVLDPRMGAKAKHFTFEHVEARDYKIDDGPHGPLHERHEFRVMPRNLTGMTVTPHKRGATFHDPSVATLEHDPEMPAGARGSVRLKPEAGMTQTISHESQPHLLYRGMSHEEFHQSKARGYLQSPGHYNMGGHQEGRTYFSTKVGSAESYAHGFAPMEHQATPGRHAYVVAIHRQPEHTRHPNDPEHEIGVQGQVPWHHVAHVWEGRVYGGHSGSHDLASDRYHHPGKYRGGSAATPTLHVGWRDATHEHRASGGETIQKSRKPNNPFQPQAPHPVKPRAPLTPWPVEPTTGKKKFGETYDKAAGHTVGKPMRPLKEKDMHDLYMQTRYDPQRFRKQKPSGAVAKQRVPIRALMARAQAPTATVQGFTPFRPPAFGVLKAMVAELYPPTDANPDF